MEILKLMFYPLSVFPLCPLCFLLVCFFYLSHPSFPCLSPPLRYTSNVVREYQECTELPKSCYCYCCCLVVSPVCCLLLRGTNLYANLLHFLFSTPPFPCHASATSLFYLFTAVHFACLLKQTSSCFSFLFFPFLRHSGRESIPCKPFSFLSFLLFSFHTLQ